MSHWVNSRPICLIIDRIQWVTHSIGRSIAWLLIVMALAESAVVILRYGLDLGSIALQESITYFHAAIFLLGSAFALGTDDHVRVDIFYRNMRPKSKAWVNLAGTCLFLLPITVLIFWTSLPYVEQSWAIKESSADAGGLQAIYLLKTLIPIFALLLFFEGLAQLLKNAQLLTHAEAS